MPQNQFAVSLNSYTWGRFDVAECVDMIARTPLRQVELPAEQVRPNSLIPELMISAPLGGQWRYSVPDLRELLANAGLTAESLDVFGFLGYPGAEGIIKRRIDLAEVLGASTIVLGCQHAALHSVGKTSAVEGDEQRQARAFIYSMLRDAGDYAADHGVRLALEVHGGIMANSAEMLRTMEEVSRPSVGINFDTANILYYNDALDAAGALSELEAVVAHVSHVHLKDFVRGETRETNSLPVLGRGVVDFRGVFDILHRAGFDGVYSLEVETFHGVTEGDDITAHHRDVLDSIEYLRSLGEFSPGGAAA